MMNYDIGILTFWDVPNYGTFAQAYALQKAIEQISGKSDVRQIAHLDKKHRDFYYDYKSYLRSYPVWKRNFWRSFKKEYTVQKNTRENLFIDAYDRIPHTEKITSSNCNNYKFDKVFLGSDIVWDFSIEPFNHDKMLFGLGFNSKEVNSYAASFGTIKPGTALPNYVVDGIKRMKHISVRDKNSADIVESITHVRPPVVLDPAWIWDFSNDSAIVAPKEKDYILVYGQDFTSEFIKNLVVYAKDSKLQIIALDCNDDHYDWCDKLVKQEELDPLEWIGFFKGAAAVATSTFHGLTFSLIFNKRIAFCKTDFILAKIDVFLNELSLLELFDDKNDVKKMLDYKWNYSQINAIVDRKREESTAVLREACE